MLPALAVANHLIQRAQQDEVTLLGAQLHTLIYLAHGLRLAMVSEPLLDDAVTANAEGVIVPALIQSGIGGERPVSRLLGEIITRPNGLLDEVIPIIARDEPAIATIERTWARFRHSSTEALERFVRKAGGPWHDSWHSPERMMGRYSSTLSHTWEPVPADELPVPIPNTLIRAWFRAVLLKDLREQSASDGLEETVRISGAEAQPVLRWNPSISLLPL